MYYSGYELICKHKVSIGSRSDLKSPLVVLEKPQLLMDGVKPLCCPSFSKSSWLSFCSALHNRLDSTEVSFLAAQEASWHLRTVQWNLQRARGWYETLWLCSRLIRDASTNGLHDDSRLDIGWFLLAEHFRRIICGVTVSVKAAECAIGLYLIFKSYVVG